MKKFTKVLSIVLLVAMCVSMFTISSFADNHNCADYVVWNQQENSETNPHFEAVDPTCTAAGNVEYWMCGKDSCSLYYADEACTVPLKSVKVPALDHDLYLSKGEPATCTTAGTADVQYCRLGCKQHFDLDGNVIAEGKRPIIEALGHEWGEWVETPATLLADGSRVRKCSVCGVEDSETIPQLKAEFAVTQTNGAKSYAYEDGASYGYNVVGGKVEKVTADGVEIDFSMNSDGTRIHIDSTEVSSNKGPTIDLMFYSEDDAVVTGLSITKAENLSNGTLKVDGFDQKGFIKGSTESLTLTTNDSNPANVKLFSFEDGVYVDMGKGDYSFTDIGGGNYTFTFKKSFLDTLETGTYYARCMYGAGDYKPAGTLVISLSATTTGSTSLVFSNSTVSKTEFKYVSGQEGPRLYCELFRDSAENLQISTNGGTSWKDVSVYDYYVEQSNGKSTSYAWIKTSFLDNLPASSNVYFRVVVPASARGASTDAISNWVKITTGHTLAAVDTNKHVINSSKSLKFVCSDVIEKVYVGGQDLSVTDPDAFKVSADGKYVTLYAEFLNARTAGSTYTLSVLTKSGEKLSTTFQILTTAQASASPRTGDDSNIALWSAFLLMSGAAVVAVLPRLKKHF